MKLYTEREITESLESIGLELMVNDFFQISEPIELPSDEEVKEYIDSTPYYGSEFKEGIEDGIKWLKEQILNQNK